MKFKYRKAEEADVPGIYEVMRDVERTMENPEMFCSDGPDFIARHITKEGFILLAFFEEQMAAFLIVRYPREEKDNLGIDIGLEEKELDKVVHMESVAVLQKYRGHGIQRELIKMAEAMLEEQMVHLLATVSPNNRVSLKNFCNLGYEIKLTKEKYGDKIRHIMYKERF